MAIDKGDPRTAATMPRILLVEDNEDDADLIQAMLAETNFSESQVVVVERLREALKLIHKEGPFDVVLLDLSLPDAIGLDTFQTLHAGVPDTPVVVLTGLDDERVANQAVREGAQDYLVKNTVDSRLLGRAIRYAVERKQAESERRHLEARMHNARYLESLAVLAGGVAHDFNNLLMGILGNVQLTLMDLPPDSNCRAHLQHAKDLIHRAAELTKQLLAYSGQRSFPLKAVDANEVVLSLKPSLQAEIPEGTSVEYELAESLPPIEADAHQLSQAILNVVVNAHEALDGKAGAITVRTGSLLADRAYLDRTRLGSDLPVGRYISVEVIDAGCGMDEETLEKALDPFFTTKFQGRGLGLAAVLGVMRGHRGAMRISSSVGKGTTVTMLLPCGGDATAASDEIDAAAGADSSVPQLVLLLDTEEAARKIGRRILDRAGFDVLPAVDLAEAAEAYGEQLASVSAVIIDLANVQGPVSDVLSEIRAKCPDTTICISGLPEASDVSIEELDEAARLLEKPWDSQDLADELRACCADRPK